MLKKKIKPGRPALGGKYPKLLTIPATVDMIAYVKLMGRTQSTPISGAEFCRRNLFREGWQAEFFAMGGSPE